MSVVEFLVVPVIVFMVIVAPIWLVLHYRSQSKVNRGLSKEETEALVLLTQKSERMSERLKTLEAILDAEVPDWRERA